VTSPNQLAARIRDLRRHYDALSPGSRATLKRCSTANDVLLEGDFWRLIAESRVADDVRARVAHVVACFPAAKQASTTAEPFGTWLRNAIYSDVSNADLLARSTRVRRLLVARDRDELVHGLRRLVRHGFQKSQHGLDWGQLGADIVYWGDGVRRRWAQDFFAPAKRARSATSTSEEVDHV